MFYHGLAQLQLVRPPKSLWFLVIGRLQNRCGDALFLIKIFVIFFVLLFCQPVMHVYWNQTKFPKYGG